MGIGNMNFNDPETLGLLSAAAQMFQNSGPSTTRRSTGQIIGGGLMGGLQGYQQAQQMQARMAEEKQQAEVRKMQMDDMKRKLAMDETVRNVYKNAYSSGGSVPNQNWNFKDANAAAVSG